MFKLVSVRVSFYNIYIFFFLIFYSVYLHFHFVAHGLASDTFQRERKQRKAYSDYLIDDDHEGARGFSVAEKLESSRFAQVDMVREMKGHDLTIS